MRWLLLISCVVLAAAVDLNVEVYTKKGETPKKLKLTSLTNLKDNNGVDIADTFDGGAIIDALNKADGSLGLAPAGGDVSVKVGSSFCVPKKKCKVPDNSKIYFAKWSSMKTQRLDTTKLRADAKKEFGDSKQAADSEFVKKFEDEAVIGVKCEGPACTTGTFDNPGGKPVAVIVLGPSASGKSFITSSKLDEILKANNLPTTLKFHTVDGGKIREVSKTWKWGYDECIKESFSAGCKDLYDDEAFSKGFKRIKKFFSEKWMKTDKHNVMIVETLASFANSKVKSFYKDTFVPLTKDYIVVTMAVYASKANCQFSGSSRAVLEGKGYPKDNKYSWQGGLDAMEAFFNMALNFEKSKGSRRTTFAIIRNNFNDPDTTEPTKLNECKQDIMKHMDCRAKDHPLRLYSPTETDKHKFQWQKNGSRMPWSATDAIMTLATTTDPKRETQLDPVTPPTVDVGDEHELQIGVELTEGKDTSELTSEDGSTLVSPPPDSSSTGTTTTTTTSSQKSQALKKVLQAKFF